MILRELVNEKDQCVWRGQGTVCIVAAGLKRTTGSTTVGRAASRRATEYLGREKE